jgi:hypothetical protein
MGQAMIRISDRARQNLREIAELEEEPMQTVLERAVEEYRRRHFLEQVNQAYERLREDPEAWSEIQGEGAAWDATLRDGLPADESWTEQGELALPARGEGP